MPQRQSGWKPALLGLILVVFASGVVLLGKARPGDNVSAAPPAPTPKAEDYVGGDTCLGCHDIEAAFKKNPHYKRWNETARPWSERGCESCHGPGNAHVEGGGDVTKIFTFKKASAQKINDTCLNCHLQQEERANFLRNEHGLNSVACTECHSIHAPQVSESLLTARSPALCYQCHAEVRVEFNKPFHHRVNEGLMSCTDCHNQHGGFNLRQTRFTTGNDVVCFTCHADKQGPFVFEHPAVKMEGCSACHQVHGSVNPRMLKRSEVRFLCLDCHSGTTDVPGFEGVLGHEIPSFHNLTTPEFQNCTSCHSAIHGSNISPVFFQ